MDNTTDHSDHDDFGGFLRDRRALVERRRALRLGAGLGLGGLLSAWGVSRAVGATGATSASSGSAAPESSTTSTLVAPTTGTEIPDETAGPFPANGTNGPNVLTDGAVLREDLTTSFGDLEGTAEGVPLTLQLTVVDAATAAPRAGVALYLWHCTADGRYSLYEIADQNFLRGVQVADDAGRVDFTTVFPGCYRGRWPHFHFEVYEDLDVADDGAPPVKTSQIALPESDCAEVYADARYGDSASLLDRLSLDTDGVFRDGWSEQLAAVAGNADDGYTAALVIRV